MTRRRRVRKGTTLVCAPLTPRYLWSRCRSRAQSRLCGNMDAISRTGCLHSRRQSCCSRRSRRSPNPSAQQIDGTHAPARCTGYHWPHSPDRFRSAARQRSRQASRCSIPLESPPIPSPPADPGTGRRDASAARCRALPSWPAPGRNRQTSSCPGIPDLDRCRQQRVLECPYGARDRSRIGRRQLGSNHTRDAIDGRGVPIYGLYWEISTHLSRRSSPRQATDNVRTADGGRQVGSKRASLIRLCANTAECTYAWKPSRPRQLQRSSPKQRFRYEMPASTPARKCLNSP